MHFYASVGSLIIACIIPVWDVWKGEPVCVQRQVYMGILCTLSHQGHGSLL